MVDFPVSYLSLREFSWKIPPPSVTVWALPILDANHVGFFPYRLLLHGPCTRTTSCLPKPNRISRYRNDPWKYWWQENRISRHDWGLTPRSPGDHHLQQRQFLLCWGDVLWHLNLKPENPDMDKIMAKSMLITSSSKSSTLPLIFSKSLH